MGVSSLNWNVDENIYAPDGDDDSSSEDGSLSSYQNVTPEDGHLGAHNEQNGHESAYSENMNEVDYFLHGNAINKSKSYILCF
jgi:hypothetical protein